MSTYFWIGLATGIVAAIPVAGIWARRTERRVRQLEKRTRAAERLAELGTMTGGLAHEIKNPLSTVGLNIQLLQEDLEDMAGSAAPGAIAQDKLNRIQRRFDSLRRETQRLREILEDFLHFAGRIKLECETLDLNKLIDELIDFYEPQAKSSGINIRSQLSPQPALVMADAKLLKQAVLNLMINATQAMSESRENHQVHGGANELMIRVHRRKAMGNDEIHLHIMDTGPGMNRETQEKIFQPYFSTRRGGSGLGLPTTRRIIEEHNGHISVHAEPGRGSDFCIVLPVEYSSGQDQ